MAFIGDPNDRPRCTDRNFGGKLKGNCSMACAHIVGRAYVPLRSDVEDLIFPLHRPGTEDQRDAPAPASGTRRTWLFAS
jgi:hypothetical protein